MFAFTQKSAEDTSDDIQFMGDKTNDYGHTGIVIDHKKGNWDYAKAEDLRYWPESTKLNFYAISPASFVDDMIPNFGWNIAKDSKTITYSSCDEYNKNHDATNYDVMYAVAKDQTKNKNNGKVKFNFKHILSQIVFQAKTQYEGMQVDIKDIKIHNINRTGTFTFPTTAEASPTQSNWQTPAAVPANGIYTVVMNQAITVNSATKPTDISSKTPLLLVPQKLNNPWNTKTTPKTKEQADKDYESYLEINCRIQQNGVYVFGKDKYTTLYVPFEASWDPGKRYVYTLIFGGGYDDQGQPILSPINYDATAEDWPDDTNNKNDVITQ
nr:fimbrillin family protein [uncultured Prevotella sp.]